MSAPTMSRSFERSVPFEITRADSTDGGDGLTFEGYAAVFNKATRIDSWEGMFDEQIAAGAFRKTIRERTPVLQFDHGRHAIVGSIPIGSIRELREDERGLFVQARLASNWLIQPVREAIANGSIDGMSFRFEVVKEEWFDKFGVRLTDPNEIFRLMYDPQDRGPIQRTLREVKCPELGPVVFPAYAETTASVRSMAVATARRIEDDDELCRAIRASLVMGRKVELPDGDVSNEVAKMLLFRDRIVQSDEELAELDVERSDAGQGDGDANATDPTSPAESTADGQRDADQESSVVDSERQTEKGMIGTSEVDEEETRSSADGSEAEVPAEPVMDHSENRAQDEPVTGHSEPDVSQPFEAVRTTPSFLETAEAEERKAARELHAAKIRAQLAKAGARVSRYS